MVTDAAQHARFDGTVFDDNGLVTKTMIRVPLNNLHEVIGCVQIVNKKDGAWPSIPSATPRTCWNGTR